MADSNECAVCKKMMKNKHKFDKFYKIGFWILLVLLAVITTLYCCKGDLFRVTENNTTEINNNSKVDVADGNNNTINIDNGSYTIS